VDSVDPTVARSVQPVQHPPASAVTAFVPEEVRDIVPIDEMIQATGREPPPVADPERPGFAGVTIAHLTAPPTHPTAHSKNAIAVSTRQEAG